MRKAKLILLMFLLFFTINVKADNCDSKELSRLKELAKKVEFDYDYRLVDGEPVFSISAVNLNEDLKVAIINDYYSDDYREFKNNETHKATLDNFKAGEKVNVTIKGFVINFCSGKTVGTRVIRLPYYNYYYDEEKCKGNEDFKYCKQLISSNITQKEYDKQFELYLKNKENKKEETKEEKSNTLVYIIVGVGLVLAIGSVVAINIIRIRKKNMI